MDGSVKYKIKKLFYHFQKFRAQERAERAGIEGASVDTFAAQERTERAGMGGMRGIGTGCVKRAKICAKEQGEGKNH